MSGLTNSNPLMNSGSLDDYKPRGKVSSNTNVPEATRVEKDAIRQSAEERGFAIDNLATIVPAKRSDNGKASKSHTLRLYIQDINRVQTWCNDNSYSPSSRI